MLTQDFKQSLSASPQSGGVPQGQPMTPEQFQSWVGGGKTDPLASVHGGDPAKTPAFVPPTTDYPGQVLSGLKDTFTSGGEAVTKDVQNVVPNAKAAGGSYPAAVASELAGAGHVAGDIAGTVGGIFGSFIMPVLSEDTKSRLGTAIKTVGDKINSIPGMTPEIAKSIGDVINTATLKGGAEAEPALKGAVTEAPTGIKQAISDTKSALTPKPTEVKPVEMEQAANVAKQKAAQQSQKIAAEWKAPADTPKASFNKARANLEQAPDSPKFLGELGVNPAAHIEDGKFNTEDTAQTLRDTAKKMSTETLRPSLAIADYTTPKTPVLDAIKSAMKITSQDKSLTAGEKVSLNAKLAKESQALEDKYPDGMSLTDMHDEKITYAGKAGYSPIKSAEDNLSSTANRHFSSALGDMVEAKAPKDVPVHDFNAYLSKYYKSADYLDSLHTKTAPVSLGQQIARGAAKYLGAGLGVHLGGGVVSGFAGYSIGKALEHALENLKGRAQTTFIEGIKQTNPEAFKAVEQYLKDQTSGNTGVPRLNPPSAIQLPAGELGTTRDVQPESASPMATTPTTKSTNAIKAISDNATTEKSQSQVAIHAIRKEIETQMPTLQHSRAYDIAERAALMPENKRSAFIKGELGKVHPDSVPKGDMQEAIQNHLTSAEQVLKENPKADVPGLIEQTRNNIVMGLEKQGFKGVADKIRDIDLSAFKDWESFKSAIVDYVKNAQPGLSMKNVGPDPLKVAQKIGGEDIKVIQDFMAEPNSLDAYMKLQPLLEAEGLDKIPHNKLPDFFQNVIDQRNSPDFSPAKVGAAEPIQDKPTGKMRGSKKGIKESRQLLKVV